MTMYYHRHNNRFFSLFAKKVVFVIAVLALLFFAGQSVSHTIGTLVSPATAPLLRFGASVTDALNNVFPFFQTKSTLIKDNNALKQALGEANGALLTHTLLIEENKALKESFGRTNDGSRVLAYIIAKPSRSPYDTMIIDAGLAEKVAIGDIVSAFETVAIGEIIEVFEHTSKVSLFSSPEKKTSVIIEGSNITTDIIGRGGGALVFTVPHDVVVTRGEMLVLPGIEHHVIGSVVNVEILPDAPFQTITAKLPINIFEIERVFITPGKAIRAWIKSEEEIINN